MRWLGTGPGPGQDMPSETIVCFSAYRRQGGLGMSGGAQRDGKQCGRVALVVSPIGITMEYAGLPPFLSRHPSTPLSGSCWAGAMRWHRSTPPKQRRKRRTWRIPFSRIRVRLSRSRSTGPIPNRRRAPSGGSSGCCRRPTASAVELPQQQPHACRLGRYPV